MLEKITNGPLAGVGDEVIAAEVLQQNCIRAESEIFGFTGAGTDAAQMVIGHTDHAHVYAVLALHTVFKDVKLKLKRFCRFEYKAHP